jgi:hypothetical protein
MVRFNRPQISNGTFLRLIDQMVKIKSNNEVFGGPPIRWFILDI